MLHVSDTAPDFTLPDEQGNTVTLSSFRGRQPVVLIFYPGDQTPVCTMQMCSIRDNYDAFTDAGAVIFGINPGNAPSHQKFAQRNKLQFHLLVDAEKEVAKMYDVMLLNIGRFAIINRTVYVVGTKGTIIFAQRGMPATETILQAIHQ
jgi:peroxiredoxin Q/BCP